MSKLSAKLLQLSFFPIIYNIFITNLDIEKNIAEKIFFDSNTPERFEYVEIDEYFPKTVLDNLERWKNSIVPNANLSIRDYVPVLNLDEIYK